MTCCIIEAEILYFWAGNGKMEKSGTYATKVRSLSDKIFPYPYLIDQIPLHLMNQNAYKCSGKIIHRLSPLLAIVINDYDKNNLFFINILKSSNFDVQDLLTHFNDKNFLADRPNGHVIHVHTRNNKSVCQL